MVYRKRPRGAIFSCFHGNPYCYHGNMKILLPWGVQLHHIFTVYCTLSRPIVLLLNKEGSWVLGQVATKPGLWTVDWTAVMMCVCF